MDAVSLPAHLVHSPGLLRQARGQGVLNLGRNWSSLLWNMAHRVLVGFRVRLHPLVVADVRRGHDIRTYFRAV